MNLPNLISLARLLSVPIILWLVLTDRLAAAFWVFLAAGISDALDGAIAKAFDQASELGGYLDPIADKALLVGVFIVLGWRGDVPVWLAILVVSRDLLLVGGIALTIAMGQSVTMAPIMASKVNTAAQIALAAVILGGRGLGVDTDPLPGALTWIVAGTTAVSGAIYLMIWARGQSSEGDGS